MNYNMHQELNAYKAKRKDRRELRKTREAAPQTKSMIKRLRTRAQKIALRESSGYVINILK